jgi:hypothetical protein
MNKETMVLSREIEDRLRYVLRDAELSGRISRVSISKYDKKPHFVLTSKTDVVMYKDLKNFEAEGFELLGIASFDRLGFFMEFRVN